MADLSETPDWTTGIYQLETSDPVLAGPDGIDNLQAKQLANRTLWLKTQLQQLADSLANLDGLQPLDAALTALAALQTVADRMIYTTGPDAFATTALTAFARQLLAAVDQAAARAVLDAAPLDSPTLTGAPKAPTAPPGTNTTQLANTAFVQAAIAALVASSPAALDTLNELAAALGNDPNFATTMTNALAGKVSGDWISAAGLIADDPGNPYMRRRTDNSLVYLQPKLGFTPIQQGGGANQGTNKLYIGWGADGTLRLQVDSTDFGSAWPIAIAGRAQGNHVLTGAAGLSGTAVDFTAIPSWVKRLRVCLNGASLNANTAIMAQLGTSAGVVTGGYGGTVAVTNNGNVGASTLSSGVDLDMPSGATAAMEYNGILEFEHMGGNVWAFKSIVSRSADTRSASTSGVIALPGTLTTLRLTSHTGTASFDAGTASLTYEG